MKKFLLLNKLAFHFILLLILSTGISTAQNYTRSAGIRGGQTSGFTYRQNKDDANAYEGILSFKQGGLQLTLLKQFVKPYFTEHSDNIYLVWGYGAHLGTHRTSAFEIFSRRFYNLNSITPLFGLDAYAGLEYRIKEIPLIIGADFKPFFDLAGIRFFSMSVWDFAFSLKYNF